MKKLLSYLVSASLVGLEVLAITPQGRYGGDSILLNKKLYYYGGATTASDDTSTLQDLIYLDITKSFDVNTALSSWKQEPVTGDLRPEPNYLYAMAVIPEENSIMIYGGEGYNTGTQQLQNSVVLYNATSTTWQKLAEPQPRLKQVIAGTLSRGDDHKAYLFGGRSFDTSVFPPFNRDMRIYDFSTSSWSSAAALPDNMGVRFRTPTTLAGKHLYYIGGMTANYTNTSITSDNMMVPMTDILVYHIEDNTWEMKTATGDIPPMRIMHTIAAKPNSQDILLFGGKYNISTNVPISGATCYVLHTDSMTWEKKNPVGVGPNGLYGHASVFADYSSLLFIMFGVNSTGQADSAFHVLNTETWTWDSSYLSSYPNQGSDDNGDTGAGNDNSLSGGAIAGIVIGCVAAAAIGGLLFFFIRRRRNGKSEELAAAVAAGGRIANANDTSAAGAGIGAGGGFKPEDIHDGVPHATLSPLLPEETAPPYRAQVPDEIDYPATTISLPMQGTGGGPTTAPRPQNIRPVKPDGE